MFGSSILEVAIGMIFVYLFLSLLCSAINEAIASLLNQRGKNLFEGVKNLLDDPEFTGLAKQLYNHGLVDGISKNAADPNKKNRLPSYMPSGVFSLALLDILAPQGLQESLNDVARQRQKALEAARAQLPLKPNEAERQKVADAEAALAAAGEALDKISEAKKLQLDAARISGRTAGDAVAGLQVAGAMIQQASAIHRLLAVEHPDPLGNIQRAVENLPNGHTKEALLALLDKTRRDIALLSAEIDTVRHHAEMLQQNIEIWFNDTMDRVGGWYKRWSQNVLLAISLLLVLLANADTFMLAKRFMHDNALRASVVSAVQNTIRNSVDPTLDEQVRQNFLKESEKLNLPLGWVRNAADPYNNEQIPGSVYGWLLKLVGLLITAFAVSMGAPFWFDTLSKFINLRGAGTPPGESKKGASKPA